MGRGAVPTKPEHLFSCPKDFFDSVTLYRGGSRGSSKEEKEEEAVVRVDVKDEDERSHLRTGGVVDFSALSLKEGAGRESGGDEAGVRLTCISCRATFQSSDEHRSHFKSDYHRLNVKRRIVGKEPINEDEFEAVVEGHSKGVDDDLSSISGSDNESDDPEQPSQARVLPRSNRIYFIHPSVEGVLSIWRPVVLTEKEYLQGEKGPTDLENTEKLCIRDTDVVTRLQGLNISNSESDENASHQPHTWIVLLAAGGHFAGIAVNSKDGEVLAHHTFHRYVVRAKAGGRQSTQDKSGKAPKSAGASLRRYNEAALQKLL